MAWSIAAVLRIALGSATVAAITAGGIVAPLIATTGVSPELMVIAVGSGSVIFSHVNDPGFWLFKEYFNLTIGETIKSGQCWKPLFRSAAGRVSAVEYGSLTLLLDRFPLPLGRGVRANYDFLPTALLRLSKSLISLFTPSSANIVSSVVDSLRRQFLY